MYGRRLAITDSMPGVTRDAVAVEAEIADLPVLLIDTGGIGEGEAQLDTQVYDRSRSEMARADVVLLLVDVGGLTGEDEELLELLRRSGKPSILVVNKVDNPQRDQMVSEFWQYGVPRVVGVSAAHGLGMDDLEDEILAILSEAGQYTKDETGGAAILDDGDGSEAEDPLSTPVRLAIIGQPNTGKSSLLNRLVGEERAIVSDLAGTTRDTVEARFTFRDTEFVVVDTAGIRRRSRVNENVEYYAVQRAYDAIDAAEMVVLMIDAVKGLSEQDKKIAARLTDRGRGTIVVLNKWDLLDDRGNQLNAITDRIHFLFPVFQYVPILPLSAVTGEGVDALLKRLLHVRRELHRRVDTGPLNQALQRWVEETPPPSGKKPYKVRYITQVGTNPVRFILFVNRRKNFPEFYLRFVRNRIREEMGFEHIPFFVELKE
jgi:GTP-binding protein